MCGAPSGLAAALFAVFGVFVKRNHVGSHSQHHPAERAGGKTTVCALPEGIPRTLSRAAKPFILICSPASLSLHFMARWSASCCSNAGQLQLILGLVLALVLLDVGAMGSCPEPFHSVCPLPLCALWDLHPMLLLTSLEFRR